MKKALLFIFVFLISIQTVSLFAPSAVTDTVYVSDYGAIPNDGKDDSEAIMSAIKYAMDSNTPTVIFDSGVYDFSKEAHNGLATTAYININKAENITLSGATTTDGDPATILMRENQLLPSEDLRRLLFVSNSVNVTVKNFIVDTSPYYYSAGRIADINGDTVTINVLDGHPITDNMQANLPGTYDLSTDRFIEQRLILTSADGSDAPFFTKIDDNTLQIENKAIADGIRRGLESTVKENLALFWFQGSFPEASQGIINYNCENICYENVRIWNTTGFAVTSSYCNNVTYKNVSLQPPENRLVSCPRDGFHIYSCRGTILMDGIVIDGMCDDGQNVHGEWFPISSVTGNVLEFSRFPQRYDEIEIGTELALFSTDTNAEYFKSEITKMELNTLGNLEVTLADTPPSDIVISSDGSTKEKTMADFLFFQPDKYILRNSVIRNTYRGVKLSAQNAEIYGNIFERNVYDIWIGAENDPWFVESTHPENVKIYNNKFYAPINDVSIKAKYIFFDDLKSSSVMRNILISDNEFFDCGTAIDVSNTDKLFCFGNTFTNVSNEMISDDETTLNIHTVAPADLYVSSVNTVTSDINDGDASKLYAVIRNQGDIAVEEPFTVDFYVDGRLFESVICDSSIEAGRFITLQTEKSYNGIFGSHIITAIVNDDESVFEYSNADNRSKKRFVVDDL